MGGVCDEDGACKCVAPDDLGMRLPPPDLFVASIFTQYKTGGSRTNARMMYINHPSKPRTVILKMECTTALTIAGRMTSK